MLAVGALQLTDATACCNWQLSVPHAGGSDGVVTFRPRQRASRAMGSLGVLMHMPPT
jgi:hypothetical protein